MSTQPETTMTEKQSLLPPEDSRPQGWGIFGYRGAMCDAAIRSDNAPMLSECLDRDFFDPDDQMLTFTTVREFCRRTAPACYAMLEERAPAHA